MDGLGSHLADQAGRVVLGNPLLIEGRFLSPSAMHDVCWCQDPSEHLESMAEERDGVKGHVCGESSRVVLGKPLLIEGHFLSPSAMHDFCWCQGPSDVFKGHDYDKLSRVMLGNPLLIEGHLLSPSAMHDVCWCEDTSEHPAGLRQA